MQSEWPDTVVESIEDLVQQISKLSICEEVVYRGQSNSEWSLQTSLDRCHSRDSGYEDRLKDENLCVASFCNEARPFLGQLERAYAFSSTDKVDKVTRMTVMQHFGAPTRLLDWTLSVMVAAYFACIGEYSREGAVWWMNLVAVERFLDSHWTELGAKRKPEPDGEVDLNDMIFEPRVRDFVSMLHLRVPFPRARAQRALFTVGSRLGAGHDSVLKNQLSEKEYGRIVIPANLKNSVITYLERMGIDAVSLQYAGADRAALRLAWERNRRPGLGDMQDQESFLE